VPKSLKATAFTPQILILLIDDSGSMGEPAGGGQTKAEAATSACRALLKSLRRANHGSAASRYYVSLARFGNECIPFCELESPDSIDEESILFRADLGTTDMEVALKWARAQLEGSLEFLRNAILAFEESMCPTPLLIFISDGENTGRDVQSISRAIRELGFQSGPIDVVACGIAMKPESFRTMTGIASQPDFAVNIESSQLAQFIADAGLSKIAGGHGVEASMKHYSA
jgi:hypothetical protein